MPVQKKSPTAMFTGQVAITTSRKLMGFFSPFFLPFKNLSVPFIQKSKTSGF
jgi:hypothetical protein